VVFAARTLFGFTLGVLLGLLIRRTVPAMAATAVAWVAVVVPSMVWLRPLIQKPITVIGHPAKGTIASSHVPPSGAGNEVIVCGIMMCAECGDAIGCPFGRR
jgi:hypothetical protein